MKKALLLIIVLSMLLSLCACGNTGASTQEVTSNTQQTSEPESVQTTNSSEESADQNVTEPATEDASAPVVYFTSDISPEGLRAIYEALGWRPTGNLAVKVSTGEPPASNYLRQDLIGELVTSLNGTYVECLTAYKAHRD